MAGVRLTKSASKTIGKGRYSYTPTYDGNVPEYVLHWRRYDYGSAVPNSSAIAMRNNDLNALRDYFVKAPILRALRNRKG